MFKKKQLTKYSYGLSQLAPESEDYLIRRQGPNTKKQGLRQDQPKVSGVASSHQLRKHQHTASLTGKSAPKITTQNLIPDYVPKRSSQPIKAPDTPTVPKSPVATSSKKQPNTQLSSTNGKQQKARNMVGSPSLKSVFKPTSPKSRRQGNLSARVVNQNQNPMHSRRKENQASAHSDANMPKGKLNSVQSVDLFDHYEGIVSLSQKFETKTCDIKNSGSYNSAGAYSPINQEAKKPKSEIQIVQHRSNSAVAEYPQSCKGFDQQFLMCDEELDMRKPAVYFAERTQAAPKNQVTTHHRTSSSAASNYALFDKYLSNDLAVVEQRIVSEEEREIICSPTNITSQKTGGHMSQLLGYLSNNNKENLMNTANTATSQKEEAQIGRQVSPFDAGRQASRKKVININVRNLVQKKKAATTPAKSKVVLLKKDKALH